MKYGIVGAKGRMGKELRELFSSHGDELVLEVDVDYFEERGTPEVIVDFSSPSAVSTTVELCKRYSAHLVIGTTALTQEHFELLRELGKQVAVVQSFNFSEGIAIFQKLLRDFSHLFAGWDCWIVETHHNQKKDAPSGTAIMLKHEVGREVPISSLRIGGVFGEHVIYFANAYEVFELKHSALSRKVFASGARRAALFCLKAKKGFYNFLDVLEGGIEDG